MEMEMQFSSLNYKLNMFPYNVQSTWNTISNSCPNPDFAMQNTVYVNRAQIHYMIDFMRRISRMP